MWIGIVLAVLNLLSNLPELIEKIKAIFEMLRRVPKMKVVHEASKLALACNAKLQMHALGEVGPCPVDALFKDLKARYP